MGLYGLPEGAFERAESIKHPAGVVVVWETTVRQSATAWQATVALAFAHLPRYASRDEEGITLLTISFSSC